MISFRSVTRDFGRVRALDGLSFEAAPGSVFALLGPNGAGKTVAMNLIAGLLRPTSGTVLVAGAAPAPPGTKSDFHRAIGIVPDRQNLYERLTARENLALFARLYRVPLARADALLAELGLAGKARALAKQLSLGMRQKLLIARALLHDPAVLLLDEPTRGLDAQMARQIRTKVRTLAAAGKTVFLTTHYLEEAEELASTVAILNRGRILAQGQPRELVAAAAAESLREVFLRLTDEESGA